MMNPNNNINLQNISTEDLLKELEQFLSNFTKPEINEFYNQLNDKVTKLSENKQDYIDLVINKKKAVNRGKAFAEWVK